MNVVRIVDATTPSTTRPNVGRPGVGRPDVGRPTGRQRYGGCEFGLIARDKTISQSAESLAISHAGQSQLSQSPPCRRRSSCWFWPKTGHSSDRSVLPTLTSPSVSCQPALLMPYAGWIYRVEFVRWSWKTTTYGLSNRSTTHRSPGRGLGVQPGSLLLDDHPSSQSSGS